MRTIRGRAYGKVNLTLDVVGRRPDGYHELRSVFALVSLADEVRVSRARHWHVSIRPPLGVPVDLAERAARLLAARLGRDDGAAISIRKRIPLAAGLGGGSSDAAFVIRALATLWDADEAVVREVAASVGSDVSFFLDGPVAEVAGRGEIVRPLPPVGWDGILVPLACRISTADAFAGLARSSWSDGRRTRELVRALSSGRVDGATIRALLGDDLDAVASSLCAGIADVRARVPELSLFVSGSGPTLFAIADDRAHALAMKRRLRRANARAIHVRIGSP